MKKKGFLGLFLAVIFLICTAGSALASHEVEKGTSKGTVTSIKIVEIELTVKDDKGAETMVETTDATFKLGDRVVIKDGKVTKEVKPLTGGY